MLTIQDATDLATDGQSCNEIVARAKAALPLDESRRALLEIALLAITAAAHITDDETALQHRIDKATSDVALAMRIAS